MWPFEIISNRDQAEIFKAPDYFPILINYKKGINLCPNL